MTDNLVIERAVLIIFFLIVISLLLRLIYYHSKLRAISRYYEAYERFRKAASTDPSDFNPHAELLEKQTEIVKLFQQAHLSPSIMSFAEPMGYGLVQPRQISAWDNLNHRSAEIQFYNLHSFHKSIGYFRARRNETISPIFWIESLITWPRSVVGFLGFDSDGVVAKSLQIIALILEIAGGIIFVANGIQ